MTPNTERATKKQNAFWAGFRKKEESYFFFPDPVILINNEPSVNQISKRINLNDEQKCELYDKLIKIDNYVMEILNKQYFRKRMININYLAKKRLEEMGCEKYKLIYLKISPQTLEIYEKWWDSYKYLKK